MIRSVQVKPVAKGRWKKVGLLAALGLLGLAGCEVDSFMDPSVVGRWERTPVVMPILDQLDVIDEPPAHVEGYSQVAPEDLIADKSEYIIGPGDSLAISVNELQAGTPETAIGRRVDELGIIRLQPPFGTMKVAGISASRLEKELADILVREQQLKEPVVSVQVTDARQRTYTLIGEGNISSGTSVGIYAIPYPDFRILDAVAQAHGVGGQVKTLYVIRGVQLDKYQTPATAPAGTEEVTKPVPPANPADLIQDLMKGLEPGEPGRPGPGLESPGPGRPGSQAPQGPEAPLPLQTGLDTPQSAPQWVNVAGKWVRTDLKSAAPPTTQEAATTQPAAVSQRVIEVPYDRLTEGDLRYNVVIRPGDIIRVPAPSVGNIYTGGFIARGGTYSLPGEKDMNLKQLVFAAGGLNGVAIPERVDLIRRIGTNQEATVRLNLRAIFNGTQPDFFLKPNDTINFGTNFLATPLSIIRSGFRYSFGFGFELDRNFDQQVFGSQSGTGSGIGQ